MLRGRQERGRRICLGGRRVLRPPWSESFLGSAVFGDLFCVRDCLRPWWGEVGESGRYRVQGRPRFQHCPPTVRVEESVDVRVMPSVAAAGRRYAFVVEPDRNPTQAHAGAVQIHDTLESAIRAQTFPPSPGGHSRGVHRSPPRPNSPMERTGRSAASTADACSARAGSDVESVRLTALTVRQRTTTRRRAVSTHIRTGRAANSTDIQMRGG